MGFGDSLGADALMAYLDDFQCFTPPPQPQRTGRSFCMPSASASPASLPQTPSDLKAVTSPVATESTKAPSASASISSTPDERFTALLVWQPCRLCSQGKALAAEILLGPQQRRTWKRRWRTSARLLPSCRRRSRRNPRRWPRRRPGGFRTRRLNPAPIKST